MTAPTRHRSPGQPSRLLLVYPATEQLGWVRRFQLPPLSLQMVAAVTPPAWEVVLADEVHEEVPFEGDFDLVGITAMTHQATRAYQIADRFRAQNVPVVLGGMHPSVLPEEALSHADAVVVGEAERSGQPCWRTLRPAISPGSIVRRFPRGRN
jgi:B12 binding domain.